MLINLPHTWNALDVMDDILGCYRGTCWYKKELHLDRLDGSQVFQYFEGVNQVTHVIVNGKLAGIHAGGYNAFSMDIASLLNLKRNTILVKVNNMHNPDIPPHNADFSFFGGIYRDVYVNQIFM